MGDKNHEKFGSPIMTSQGPSRWFRGEPEISEVHMATFEQRWMCPMDNCNGEMQYNGSQWPMSPPGYHHTCTECGFTAALCGVSYPRNVYRPQS